LLALANQGRAAAGEATLNSVSPTDKQQALYMLPQSDYNAITSGTNGFSAGAGYNLATGLGTPVADLLLPDLIAHQGPGTSYSGPTVASLQDTGLVNTGTSDGGPMDVFSVFDALPLAGDGLDDAQAQVLSTEPRSPINETLAPVRAGPTTTSTLIAAGIAFGPATNLSAAALMPLPPAAVAITPVSTDLVLQQPGWSTAQPVVNPPASSEHSVVILRTDRANMPGSFLKSLRAGLVLDSVLDEIAGVGMNEDGGPRTKATPIPISSVLSLQSTVVVRGWKAAETIGALVLPWEGLITDAPTEVDSVPHGTGLQPAPYIPKGKLPVPQPESSRQPAGFTARLAVILLAAGSSGYGAASPQVRNRRAGGLSKQIPRDRG
jgi:hypothetical protein